MGDYEVERMKLAQAERRQLFVFSLTVVSIFACGLTLLLALLPQYWVYSETLAGKGRLAEAESSRQIATLEAKAKLESAKMLADAEIERAKGVAEANKIIGEGLKGHEEYLMYLWVQSLTDKDNHVIYIPTEANIPILEAGRFSRPATPKIAKDQQ